MKNYIKNYKDFLNESMIFEAARPMPKMWHTITPARYKQEMEFMAWFRTFPSIEDKKARKAEMGYVHIWDFNGYDILTGKDLNALEDGSRPPICDAIQKDWEPIIQKQRINSVKPAEVIGVPIKVGNFMVAQHDLPVKMSWWEAEYSCVNLGAGWYLPNKKQMQEMLKVADEIGLVQGESYWGDASPPANAFGDFWGFYKGKSGDEIIDTESMIDAGFKRAYLCRPVKK